MSGTSRSALALNVRRLRKQRGMSTVELSRRASVSRATLSQIEAGEGNPRLETLYALSNALGASLADLIAEVAQPPAPRVVRVGTGTRVLGEAVEAWLLDTLVTPASTVEVYDLRLHGTAVQRSEPHAAGTREHVHLHAGRARVGPADGPIELGPGDYVAYDAGVEHLYEPLGPGDARGTLVITRAHHA